MKYEIVLCSHPLYSLWRYEIRLLIGRSWFCSEGSYKNHKDAVRAAKRAGGTEEVK